MRLLQASLALIERPVARRQLRCVDRRRSAGRAGRSCRGRRRRPRRIRPGSAARWRRRARPLAPSETLDGQLAAALSGPPPAAPVRVEWEGQRYVVDRAAATRARIERVREAQGRPSVDAALADRGGAGRRPGRVDLRVRAAGDRSRAARQPRRGAPRFRAAARVGAQDRRAWRLAEPASAGAPWHLSGSLLGLDVALAVPSLRRVSDDPPAPTLPAADRVAFARTVALLPARALTDASRDTVAPARRRRPAPPRRAVERRTTRARSPRPPGSARGGARRWPGPSPTTRPAFRARCR